MSLRCGPLSIGYKMCRVKRNFRLIRGTVLLTVPHWCLVALYLPLFVGLGLPCDSLPTNIYGARYVSLRKARFFYGARFGASQRKCAIKILVSKLGSKHLSYTWMWNPPTTFSPRKCTYISVRLSEAERMTTEVAFSIKLNCIKTSSPRISLLQKLGRGGFDIS